jgi:predicted esterase
MSKLYHLWRKAFLLPVLMLLFAASAFAQAEADTTLTPRYIATGPNSNGFYEYLPKGYVEGTAKYPLIVSLHGDGELGNGTTQLPILLNDAIPMYINQHLFPESVKVNGQTTSFIVIIPQFVAWPDNDDVDAVITYAEKNYRVDENRIYLTGYSMGGGAAWTYAGTSATYANKLAAMFVVAGAKAMNAQMGDIIAASNLPVFATNNSGDPTIPYTVTVDNVNLINSAAPPPAIPAIDTIFNAAGHDAWTLSFNPFIVYSNGLNAYQWLAQYSRADITPLPVTLSAYTATLSEGKPFQVSVNWTTSFEQNDRYFILQRSGDGQTFSNLDTIPAQGQGGQGASYTYPDMSPMPGADYYRLTEVDDNGQTALYSILKVEVPVQGGSVFRLSPNPASGPLNLELTDPYVGELQVSLTDVQGRTLRKWTFQKQGLYWEQSIDPGAIPSGGYFITIRGGTVREAQAFIEK